MHGGTNPGPPLGNRNGWKHGRRSAAAVAARKKNAAHLREFRQTLDAFKLYDRAEQGHQLTPQESARLAAFLARSRDGAT
jgi:hypothetical protein